MTEHEWFHFNWPLQMLQFLIEGKPTAYMRRMSLATDRKLRLFACTCCRQTWRQQNERDRKTTEVAELFADGEATEEELIGVSANIGCAPGWSWCATNIVIAVCLMQTINGHHSVPHITQANLLREVVGNPYHPIDLQQPLICRSMTCPERDQERSKSSIQYIHGWKSCGRCGWRFGPDWLTWDVRILADVAYTERQPDGTLDPHRLAVLADAMEEAGCAERTLLDHLRGVSTGSFPHFRGCWAIDLLTGRE